MSSIEPRTPPAKSGRNVLAIAALLIAIGGVAVAAFALGQAGNEDAAGLQAEIEDLKDEMEELTGAMEALNRDAQESTAAALVDIVDLDERVTELALVGAETIELTSRESNIQKAEYDAGFACLQENWDEYILSSNEGRSGNYNGNCDELDFPRD